MLNHKAAGYTHRISWEEYSDDYRMYLKKSFPTTPDAVQLHLDSLNEMAETRDIKNITCEVL